MPRLRHVKSLKVTETEAQVAGSQHQTAAGTSSTQEVLKYTISGVCSASIERRADQDPHIEPPLTELIAAHRIKYRIGTGVRSNIPVCFQKKTSREGRGDQKECKVMTTVRGKEGRSVKPLLLHVKQDT